MDDRVQISELIYKSFLTLDDLNFEGFIALCDPNYNYKITAYSPEIRKEMIWLEESHDSLKLLFDNLPKHNSDHSRLARLGNVYLVNKSGAHEWDVVTFLEVFRTTLDGGATELFAVAKVYDKVTEANKEFKLLNREIKMETRMFGFGHHIPF